jgi:hypothetical protein
VPDRLRELVRRFHPALKRKVRASLVTSDDLIELIAIGPRRSIDEETLRILRREQ